VLDMTLTSNNARRHADSGRSTWNIAYDDSIRPNACVVAYRDRPQNLGARPYVDVTTDSGHASVIGTDGDLLEQQAVRADFSVRMYDDAIRVRQLQSASQLAIQRNVGAGHHAPTSVAQYCPGARQPPPQAPRSGVPLVRANAGQ
jgi:hypothetical protein